MKSPDRRCRLPQADGQVDAILPARSPVSPSPRRSLPPREAAKRLPQAGPCRPRASRTPRRDTAAKSGKGGTMILASYLHLSCCNPLPVPAGRRRFPFHVHQGFLRNILPLKISATRGPVFRPAGFTPEAGSACRRQIAAAPEKGGQRGGAPPRSTPGAYSK